MLREVSEGMRNHNNRAEEIGSTLADMTKMMIKRYAISGRDQLTQVVACLHCVAPLKRIVKQYETLNLGVAAGQNETAFATTLSPHHSPPFITHAHLLALLLLLL